MEVPAHTIKETPTTKPEPGWSDLINKHPDLPKSIWFDLMEKEDIGPQTLTYFFAFIAANDTGPIEKRRACVSMSDAISEYNLIHEEKTFLGLRRQKETPFQKNILNKYVLPSSSRFSGQSNTAYLTKSIEETNAQYLFMSTVDSRMPTPQPLHYLIACIRVEPRIFDQNPDLKMAALTKFLEMGKSGTDIYGPPEMPGLYGKVIKNIQLADLFPDLFPGFDSYGTSTKDQVSTLKAESLQLQQQLSKVTTEKEKAAQENLRLQQQLAEARQQIAAAASEKAKIEQINQELQRQLAEARANPKVSNTEIPHRAETDPYTTLGLKPDATQEQFRTAFREFQLALNPEFVNGQIAKLEITGHGDIAALLKPISSEMLKRTQAINSANDKIQKTIKRK